MKITYASKNNLPNDIDSSPIFGCLSRWFSGVENGGGRRRAERVEARGLKPSLVYKIVTPGFD
jgi:hypothetical protein